MDQGCIEISVSYMQLGWAGAVISGQPEYPSSVEIHLIYVLCRLIRLISCRPLTLIASIARLIRLTRFAMPRSPPKKPSFLKRVWAGIISGAQSTPPDKSASRNVAGRVSYC